MRNVRPALHLEVSVTDALFMVVADTINHCWKSLLASYSGSFPSLAACWSVAVAAKGKRQEGDQTRSIAVWEW